MLKSYIQDNEGKREVIITSEKRSNEDLRYAQNNPQNIQVSGIIKDTQEKFECALRNINFITN